MAVSRKALSPDQHSSFLGDVLHLITNTPPRSLEATRKLAAIGQALLAVKISRVAAVVGLPPSDVPLPPGAHLLVIGRGEDAVTPSLAHEYEVDDVVFLLHDQRHEPALREIFTSPNPLCVLPRHSE